MGARTGSQFLEGRTTKREIWVDGERIEDVTAAGASGLDVRSGCCRDAFPLATTPHVSVAKLSALSDLVRNALRRRTNPSTASPCGASCASRNDHFRGCITDESKMFGNIIQKCNIKLT
jgi:hypothetical protein